MTILLPAVMKYNLEKCKGAVRGSSSPWPGRRSTPPPRRSSAPRRPSTPWWPCGSSWPTSPACPPPLSQTGRVKPEQFDEVASTAPERRGHHRQPCRGQPRGDRGHPEGGVGMSTPEHVAMIEARGPAAAFFQPAPPGRLPCGWPPCTNSSGRCRPGRPSSWTPSTPTCTSPTPRGYMCELGLNLDELGYLARKLPQWAKPQRHPHPPGPVLLLQLPAGRALRGGAGDVPLELPLPAEPGPLFRGPSPQATAWCSSPAPTPPNTSRAMAELIAAVFPRTGSL